MPVEKSCPVLVIHDDDAFRRNLIKALDQHHFAVTFEIDGEAAKKVLQARPQDFRIILVALNLKSDKGVAMLDFMREHRDLHRCGVIILGDPDPAIRTFAPWADETLLKPVDPAYVATRARAYCGC